MTSSQCKVSDTQVTVKACGPLVFILNDFFLEKNILVSIIDFYANHFSECEIVRSYEEDTDGLFNI